MKSSRSEVRRKKIHCNRFVVKFFKSFDHLSYSFFGLSEGEENKFFYILNEETI